MSTVNVLMYIGRRTRFERRQQVVDHVGKAKIDFITGKVVEPRFESIFIETTSDKNDLETNIILSLNSIMEHADIDKLYVSVDSKVDLGLFREATKRLAVPKYYLIYGGDDTYAGYGEIDSVCK